MASMAPWAQHGSPMSSHNPPRSRLPDPATASQAYTAVDARKILTRPDPVQTQPTPKPASAAKIEWPPAVREYVSRAFMADNLIPGIHPLAVSERLKSVITDAAEKDMLYTIDWSTYLLPQELIRLEQQNVPQSINITNMTSQHITSSKKRKSLEMEENNTESIQAPIPPWRLKAAGNGLADRMTYLAKGQTDKRQKKIQDFRAGVPTSKFNDLEKRKQRFELGNAGPSSPTFSSSRDDTPMPDADAGPVVGTCHKLEKNYFRLTAPPKPETVRPLPVLRKTIELLIRKWKEEHNYGYICDQFKSLRQDLTVQHIKNDFTVRVYEAHARIALEKGDLGEYNQCQTQLRALYKQKLGGCPGEFTAYRIFYFIHTSNRTGLNDVLADLTTTDKQHPAVQHALLVRASLASGNYHKFFKLFQDPPNMGGYLMDMFVNRERLAYLSRICRAYKPDLKVDYLASELAFDGEDEQQCSSAFAQFICDHGGSHLFEDRDGSVRFLAGKAGSLLELARQKAFGRVDIKGQI